MVSSSAPQIALAGTAGGELLLDPLPFFLNHSLVARGDEARVSLLKLFPRVGPPVDDAIILLDRLRKRMRFVPQAHKPVHLLLAPRISVEQTPNCMPEMSISHPSVCPFLQAWKSAVTDWSIFSYSHCLVSMIYTF